MTQEEILEGNRIIAGFMGKLTGAGISTNTYNKYHTSFDWLIPVGTKILSNDFEEECIGKGFNPWVDYNMDDICENQWNLEGLFPAIVYFIEWYNDKLNQQ